MDKMKSERLAGVIKVYFFIEIYQFDENWSVWWKFIWMMQFVQWNKPSSMWWKLINLMRIHIYDRNSSMWWKSIIVMKVHLCDENGWKGRNLIDMMKIHSRKNDFPMSNLFLSWAFITVMRICQWKKVSLSSPRWWKGITERSIYYCDEYQSFWWRLFYVLEIHQCDEKPSKLISLMNTFFVF